MMMSLALRFIPILLEEANRIINAQSARGADFEEGRLWQRMRAMVSILVPLLVSATRRAYELANAMEARCYHGGEGRTKMKPLKYRAVDRISYGVLLGYLVCVIGITHFIPW
jgi:energy-coupling factor transport system permease protein